MFFRGCTLKKLDEYDDLFRVWLMKVRVRKYTYRVKLAVLKEKPNLDHLTYIFKNYITVPPYLGESQ